MSVISNQQFYWGDKIIYIPARYTVDSEGNAICTHTFSLEHAFDECTSIDTNGLYYAFSECTGITGSISFPKLTSIGTQGLYNTFSGCTGITEIHFRADAQSTVEATDGYISKFGASNATIYFDL